MPELSFSRYADRLGYGGAFKLLSQDVEPETLLFDIAMMNSMARSVNRVRFALAGRQIRVRSGITLEHDVNGTAELVGGTHFASVTIGCVLASIHAVAVLLSTPILPDFAASRPSRAPPPPLLPSAAQLSDPSLLTEVLIERAPLDPPRAQVWRYVSHLMFLFALYHEVQHCTLGHVAMLRGGGRPRLRERGGAEGPVGVDVARYHAFELTADGNAIAGLVHTGANRRDLPTRLGMFEASDADRLRLALLAMSIVMVMWHTLAAGEPKDVLHPPPTHRMLNFLRVVVDELVAQGCADHAGATVATWLDDLRAAALTLPEILPAYGMLIGTPVEPVLAVNRELYRAHPLPEIERSRPKRADRAGLS